MYIPVCVFEPANLNNLVEQMVANQLNLQNGTGSYK